MKKTIQILSILFAGITATQAAPKLEFESTFFDFGNLAGMESVSGEFKFKNTGNEILKLKPPEPSCGCTDARAVPSILAPGESGQILYRISLEHRMDTTRKQITIHSNDPDKPDVQLTMQLSYLPVYEINVRDLRVDLHAGQDMVKTNFIVRRDDEKPLGIDRFTTSQEWISASFDPAFKPQDSSARVNVTVRRPSGPPGQISGTVQLWSSNQPGAIIRTIQLAGDTEGELAATPKRIYWTIPGLGNDLKNYPDSIITRTVELKSLLGHTAEIKSVRSSIKGLSATVTPKGPGQAFNLLLRFDELPATFTNGTVTIETSLPSLPKLELPLTIAVFRP